MKALSIITMSWIASFGFPAQAKNPQAIISYTEAKDTHFKRGDLVKIHADDQATLYGVHFVSQEWLPPEDVSPRLWQHWLLITVPKNLRQKDTAIFYMGNGFHTDPMPQKGNAFVRQVALKSQSISVEIYGTPQQPLTFKSDGIPRKEDDLIAYCWDKFLQTKNEAWLVRRPMLKAAKRGMDVAEEVLGNLVGEKPKNFVAAGASKRGWATWLLPLVDTRVKAIVPMVADFLNLRESMHQHFATLGFWSPALKDYVAFRITERMDSPEFIELLKILDPFEYIHELRIPKFIMNAGNDQFFLPTSSQIYFKKLEGQKYLSYLPNSGHHIEFSGMADAESVAAFVKSIAFDIALPQLEWSLDGHDFKASTSALPTKIEVWEASSEKPDFRMMGPEFPKYRSREISVGEEKSWHIPLSPPTSGVRAGFAAFHFLVDGLLFRQTTDVFIFNAPR